VADIMGDGWVTACSARRDGGRPRPGFGYIFISSISHSTAVASSPT